MAMSRIEPGTSERSAPPNGGRATRRALRPACEHERRITEFVLHIAGALGSFERRGEERAVGEGFEQREVARAPLVHAGKHAIHDPWSKTGPEEQARFAGVRRATALNGVAGLERADHR